MAINSNNVGLVYSGSGAPGAIGLNMDFYVDSTTGNTYLNSDGSWSELP